MLHLGAVSSAWATEIEDYCTALLAVGATRQTVYTRRQHLQHFARRVTCGPWAVNVREVTEYMAAHDWAPETRRGRRSTLASFYGWGVTCGRTSSDPLVGIARIRPANPTPRPVPDTVYLEALVRADSIAALWIDLAAEHGLRRGEIAVIHSRDIVRTLFGHDLIVHGKGGKTREVPLTAAMARALLDRAAEVGGGYLFPGEDHGHISPRWLGKRVNTLLAGDWTIHKLRHRAATRFWVVSQGDPYAVADLMGWASLNMVRVYVKLPDDRKRSIVEGGEPYRRRARS